MGTVFLAEHTLIGRRAAIKVLRPELTAKRDTVHRFFNEARAATAISDPGIVQVFDFGFTADDIAYIVLELLQGEQLKHRLVRLGRLLPPDALRVTRQAAGSLAAAHAAHIVHRDLKPENLYMIPDPEAAGGERPKILDFGIAKLGDEVPDRVRTRTGVIMGTPLYMSPEQCDGASKVDHRADIYSLGCVLFHLLVGRPPFDLPGVGAILSAHLRDAPPLPSSLAPHLPPEIDGLVLRCLTKSPDQRFATMLEVQQACDAILARRKGSDVAAPMAPATPPGLVATSRTPSLPDATRTMLSTSAGQSRTAVPRRRVGRWLAAIAALVGGAGSMAILMTVRLSAHDGREVPEARRGIAPDAGSFAAAPGPAGAAVVVAPPRDAGTTALEAPDAAPASALPAPPPPPVVTRKPAASRPPIRSKKKSGTDELYDDRN
jgi:serine/threonine-protein kinase